jgi:hypothetical protein
MAATAPRRQARQAHTGRPVCAKGADGHRLWHGRATEGNDGDEQDCGNHAAPGCAMRPEHRQQARAIIDRLAVDLPGIAFMLIALDPKDDPDFDDSLTLVSNIGHKDGARLLRHLAQRLEDTPEETEGEGVSP